MLWFAFHLKEVTVKEKGDSRNCTDLCYVWFSWFGFSALWREVTRMVLEVTGSDGDR